MCDVQVETKGLIGGDHYVVFMHDIGPFRISDSEFSSFILEDVEAPCPG